ncbi:IclR family transcriptional regulator [Virgibacillus ainsalahensis]
MTEKKQRNTSLENALAMLKQFSIDTPEIGVTSLSHRLDISKSTAHRLLSSLAQEGFVYKDPQTNLYSLGSSILSLVNIVNTQIHISNEVIPILNLLVEKTNENTHLTILEGLEVVYIQTIGGEYASKDKILLGSRRPAFCTSAGQSILAYHLDAESEAARNLNYYTSKTITSQKLFLEKCCKIRKEGFSLSEEEYEEGVTGISVPVFDESGKVIASLGVTGNTKRIASLNLQQKYIHLLNNSSKELTKIIKLRKRRGIK